MAFTKWLDSVYLKSLKSLGFYKPPLTREQQAWQVLFATCVERVK